jgi:hypothetical protein
MTSEELLTRATIWLALALYAGGAVIFLTKAADGSALRKARWCWVLGCGFFIAHVLCAFAFYHDWSHAAAYAETARQTEAMTGIRSGSGLYLNYAFGLGWIAVVLWWWIAPRKFLAQPRWLSWLWNGFAVFMIFNATVVFGHGPARWLGAAICLALAVAWRLRLRASPARRA